MLRKEILSLRDRDPTMVVGKDLTTHESTTNVAGVEPCTVATGSSSKGSHVVQRNLTNRSGRIWRGFRTKLLCAEENGKHQTIFLSWF